MRGKLLTTGLFLFCGVISTHAQSGGVHVRVPFAFEVANKTLPAGEYVISSQHEEVWIRAKGDTTLLAVQANRTVHDGGKTGKVVFHCYGRLCFLSQLWLPDPEIARVILTSKAEKQAAKRREPQEFALLGEDSPKSGPTTARR